VDYTEPNAGLRARHDAGRHTLLEPQDSAPHQLQVRAESFMFGWLVSCYSNRFAAAVLE
jgi:hypothetical protein